MAIEIKVPAVGESISEVTLVKWLVNEGEYVERDAVIAELESEKATVEVNAEQAGVVTYVAKEGDDLAIGAVVCTIDSEAAKPEAAKEDKPKETAKEAPVEDTKVTEKLTEAVAIKEETKSKETPFNIKATPVAEAIISDKKINKNDITPSGSNGRILKQDVLHILENPGRKPGLELNSRNDRSEKMSNIRKTISRRLVEAKNTTAMLTTFNEVDMGPIMDIRKKYKEKFKETHGVNLGFMSFFTKACCYALQQLKHRNNHGK